MKQSYSIVMKFLRTVDKKKLFVESDAWWLFKYSALSEVIGWTLLIYGIIAPYYHLPGYTFMLAIGGSIHGMLFIAYMGILAATYSSLGWTRVKALVGFFVSALPYGTFFFEQWAARSRRETLLGSYRKIIVRAVIRKSGSVLVLQSNNSTLWQLPGGYICQDESLEEGLVRIVKELTGITGVASSLQKSRIHLDKDNKQLEFHFDVHHSKDFDMLDLKDVIKNNGDIDEMQFANLDELSNIESSLSYLKSTS